MKAKFRQTEDARNRRLMTMILSLAMAVSLALFIGFTVHDHLVEPKQDGEIAASSELAQMESGAAPDLPSLSRLYRNVQVRRKLQSMTLRDKILQMIIVCPEVLSGSSSPVTKASGVGAALQKYPVGGIILFADNLQSRDQTKALISGMQETAKASGIGLFLSVDEEGGTVSRCAQKLGTTKFKNMQNYQSLGAGTARSNAKTIAADIASFGFNLDFAPVADVNTAGNSVIGSRAYSNNYETAATLVAAAVQGFHDGGVRCTLKHFPGHGATKEDSHKRIAYLNKSLDQLRKEEFVPFERGINAGADFVMVGHIVVPSVDEQPAALSKALVTDLLRKELKFGGLVVTDSMRMGAIANNYSVEKAAVLAIAAGDDVLLDVVSVPRVLKAVKDAVKNGTLTEEQINASVRRILREKAEMGLLY